MKKLTALFMVLFMIFAFTACSPSQFAAKELGRTTTIELPEGEKFLEITWKDDNVWYLTRPMQEGEVAETYTFNQRSVSGLMEGTIIIKETITNTFDPPEGLKRDPDA